MRTRLLVLDVECPRCGTPPNIRVLPALVKAVQRVEADKPLGTWGCQHKRCTEKILITAGMIQRATQPGGKTA